VSNVNQYETGGGGGQGGEVSGVLTIHSAGMHYLEGGKYHTVLKETAAGRSGRLRGG
jgi:hypothetical protein